MKAISQVPLLNDTGALSQCVSEKCQVVLVKSRVFIKQINGVVFKAMDCRAEALNSILSRFNMLCLWPKYPNCICFNLLVTSSVKDF